MAGVMVHSEAANSSSSSPAEEHVSDPCPAATTVEDSGANVMSMEHTARGDGIYAAAGILGTHEDHQSGAPEVRLAMGQ
jgi:hypothetical protein